LTPVLVALGLIIVPLGLVAALTSALGKPTADLGRAQAAIVNLDQPVTVAGQYLPLGRQMAAELVAGGGRDQSTYDWVVTDAEDAQAGLDSGSYVARVTIGADFSAAATSFSGAPDQARRATVQVTTSPRAGAFTEPVAQAVVEAAARSLAGQLVSTYLDNIYIGFTTMHDQMSQAVDAAGALVDGAGQAAAGANALQLGLVQAATGARSLADGVGQYVSGAAELARATSQVSQGADQLADGSAQLADATGQLATGAAQLDTGLGQLSAGLDQLSAALDFLRQAAAPVIAGADAAAAWAEQMKDPAAQQAYVQALYQDCLAAGVAQPACGLARDLALAAIANPQTAAVINFLLSTVESTANQISTVAHQADSLASGADQAAAAAHQLKTGAAALAQGTAQAATGASQLADGGQRLSQGARQAADGAAQLAVSGSPLSAGAWQVSSGLDQLVAGGSQLADGVNQLDAGVDELVTGLGSAVAQVPTYTADQRQGLENALSNPIETKTDLFPSAGVMASYAVVGLWLGALAVFFFLPPVPPDLFGSRRTAVASALRALAPAAGLAGFQGLLVGATVAAIGHASPLRALATVACGLLISVAFVTLHQGLFALIGRDWTTLLAVLVAFVSVLPAITTPLPGALLSLAQTLPLAPGGQLLHAASGSPHSLGGPIAGLAIWAGAGFVVAILALQRRRHLSFQQVWAGLDKA
jgi:putative membrane protein